MYGGSSTRSRRRTDAFCRRCDLGFWRPQCIGIGRVQLRKLKESCIPADVVVIPRSADSPITEIIKEHSADADAVFLGLLVAARGMESVFAEWMAEVVEESPTTIFVRSAGESAGRLI